MAKDFAHLHVHTQYSLLDGAAKNDALFAEVARQGMPAVAMSDHGNMFGAYEFFHASKKHDGVKPIIGIEAYVAPGSRFHKQRVFWGGSGRGIDTDGEGGKDVSGGGRYLHMTMWAKNATGLRNLFRLSSLASIEGYYMKPRMDRELISQHSEGIIATTGCPSGEVQTRLRLGQYAEAVKAAGEWQDVFGQDNFYLELMDHGLSIERDVREDLLKIARQVGIPLLATNDSHYVTEDQADAHDSLLCVGVGKNKADPNRFKFNGAGYYIKTARQMRELFSELPEACDNTLVVAEQVEPYDDVFKYVDQMPQFPDVPEGETQATWLRRECEKGLAERYPDGPSQEVLERLETELSVITPMGFDAYFLVVADICRYARDNDIFVGPGRGSATGSLVAYLTRITELDPLEHRLLFERFLNPERLNPPDVDLDFDDRKRDQMVRYLTEKYGGEYTAQVNTFSTIKAKAAIKDANRILGYPYALGDRISKAMPPDIQGKGVPLAGIFDPEHSRYNEAGEIRALYENEPDVKKVFDTARGLEGLVRGTGVHAAAVILSATPLLDLIPLHQRDKDGTILTGFDYPSCEDMGLIKMDFLGLRNLGLIDHALKIIKKNRGVELSPTSIPLDDPMTYELLASGNTLGIFQLDGGPMRNLLKLMAPTRFEDIAAVLALYRPGPMAANAHINYAARKNGRQDIEPIHPELKDALEPILGTTYHLLVYQEQIMAVARELAGYSLGGADLLRRAMGKKKPEVLAKEWDKFSSGMKANGYSDEATKALWDVMLPFSGYAFNKSHTAGYGLVSVWTAYLKANYPAEFMSALLTSVDDDKDKAAIYLADARQMGVEVLRPDVNESVADFTAVGEAVRFGLKSVRNVGENVIDALVRSRKSKGKFTSFPDFLDKAELAACNKRALDSLIKAGGFDSLGHTRKGLAAVAEQAVEAIVPVKKQAAIGQDDLFGELGGEDGTPTVGLDFAIGEEEWNRKTRLSLEREMLGLYVSEHPLDGAEHILARQRDMTIAELLSSEQREGAEVRVCGLITSVERKMTKQGNTWAIVTLTDRDASVPVLFFPAAYQLVGAELVEDQVITVRGRTKDRDGEINLTGQELQVVDVAGAEHGGKPPVMITLQRMKATAQIVAELKRILAAHPGEHPVRLRLEGRQKTTVYELGYLVDPVNGFASDIKGSLGAAAWPGAA